MKSRFAFGMFAGFALASLFFFFFLYFYPSVFRAQEVKNPPQSNVIGYAYGPQLDEPVAYLAPYGRGDGYYERRPVAYYADPEYQSVNPQAPARLAPKAPSVPEPINSSYERPVPAYYDKPAVDPPVWIAAAYPSAI